MGSPDFTSAPVSGTGLMSAATPIETATIRVQLERLLDDPHIRTSKRCRAMLRHVVEASLAGTLDRVRERAIGTEVFHREPGYDTNQDSVVRTTAAEVRKRLAQYYLDPAHEGELRILLPQGSYVPEFQMPAEAQPVPAAAPAATEVVRAPRRRRRGWAWLAVAAIMVAVGVCVWMLMPSPSAELDAFWKPLLADRSDAVICIGQPLRIYMLDGPRFDELNQKMVGNGSTPPAGEDVRRQTSLTLSELKPAGDRHFAAGDTIAAARLAELMAHKGKPFQILGDRMTSYADLRGRPAILIGQFNNRWTTDLTGGLRYYLDKNAATHAYEVHDRQHPDKLVASTPRDGVVRPVEYAIVSRVFDPSTEKTVVATAGMTQAGTVAGADFLTNASYMRQAFHGATAKWWQRNIQVVLETNPMNGVAGPPKVVATYFW